MNWLIILYYVIIVVTLYLWWMIFFCAYHAKDSYPRKGTWKKGEKIKYQLWELLATFPFAFVPVLNVGLLIVELFLIEYLKDEKDAEFKSFLFKEI